jgi:hypothetical protein
MNEADEQITNTDLLQLMAWNAAALSNRKISSKDSDEIVRLGKAYAQLFDYQASYLERARRAMPNAGATPNIAGIKRHIQADEFELVVMEARKVRDLMKPILQHAKAQVDALRK